MQFKAVNGRLTVASTLNSDVTSGWCEIFIMLNTNYYVEIEKPLIYCTDLI